MIFWKVDLLFRTVNTIQVACIVIDAFLVSMEMLKKGNPMIASCVPAHWLHRQTSKLQTQSKNNMKLSVKQLSVTENQWKSHTQKSTDINMQWKCAILLLSSLASRNEHLFIILVIQ